VIAHEKEFLICIKATSRVELFKNNASKMVGCVLFKEGECGCFEKETVVEPDNQIPLRYDGVDKAYRDSTLEVLGDLPDDFAARLTKAINCSETMNEMEQKRLLKLLRRKV
jgi:hypothetical protein